MAGVVLIIAGTWVLTQVWGGNALGRLGITGARTMTGGKGVGVVRGGKAVGS